MILSLPGLEQASDWIENIFDNKIDDWERFLAEHSKPGTWTDDRGIICHATALYLGREINIYGTLNKGENQSFTKVESGPDASDYPPLTVGYYQGQHYQSLQWVGELLCPKCKNVFVNQKVLVKHIEQVHSTVANMAGIPSLPEVSRRGKNTELQNLINSDGELSDSASEYDPAEEVEDIEADESFNVPSRKRKAPEKFFVPQAKKINRGKTDSTKPGSVPDNINDNGSTKPESANQKLKCSFCNYTATRPYHLTRHITAKHNALISQSQSQPETKCPHCDTTTKRKHDMKRHVKNKHNLDYNY